jgi:hypothetical protein
MQCAFLAGSAVVLALILASPAAHAADASLLYRNYPGFQCNRWNWRNECTDFSYLDPRGGYQVPGVQGSYALPGVPQYYYHPVNYYPSSNLLYYRSPLQVCSPDRDCTGHLSVTVRGIPTVAVRGDAITYTIYVRNDDSQTRTAAVRAVIDGDVVVDAASTGGYMEGNTVVWKSVRVAAGQSATLTINARIRPSAQVGRKIPVIVSAGGQTDTATTEVSGGANYGRPPIRFINGSNPYTPYGIPTFHPVLYPSGRSYNNGNAYYYNGTPTYYNNGAPGISASQYQYQNFYWQGSY